MGVGRAVNKLLNGSMATSPAVYLRAIEHFSVSKLHLNIRVAGRILESYANPPRRLLLA